jgi:hypothetical protein
VQPLFHVPQPPTSTQTPATPSPTGGSSSPSKQPDTTGDCSENPETPCNAEQVQEDKSDDKAGGATSIPSNAKGKVREDPPPSNNGDNDDNKDQEMSENSDETIHPPGEARNTGPSMQDNVRKPRRARKSKTKRSARPPIPADVVAVEKAADQGSERTQFLVSALNPMLYCG